jgi:hypothetical protein
VAVINVIGGLLGIAALLYALSMWLLYEGNRRGWWTAEDEARYRR